LGRYRGGCEDFAGEWDHDLAAAGGVVTHKVSDSNVTTEREDVGRRSEGPARRLLSAGRSLISFSAVGTRWSLLPLWPLRAGLTLLAFRALRTRRTLFALGSLLALTAGANENGQCENRSGN
jgi:hypothetical protein